MPKNHKFNFTHTVDDNGQINVIEQYDYTWQEPDPVEPEPDQPDGDTLLTGDAWTEGYINVRSEPNTRAGTIVRKTANKEKLAVTIDRVDRALLEKIGKSNLVINEDWYWRYIPAEDAFIAEVAKDGNPVLLTNNDPNNSTDPPAPQPTGSNLKTLLRGFGANSREALNIDEAPHMNRQDIENVIALYRGMGIKTYRTYFHYEHVNFDVLMERLRWMLEITNRHKVDLMLVFDDSLGSSLLSKGCHYEGFNGYHNQALGHWHADFFKSGAYKEAEYTRRLKVVARELAKWNHTSIDIANEPALNGDRSTAAFYGFRNYVNYMTKIIYDETGGKVPSTVGIINCQHITPEGWDVQRTAEEFYGNTPYLSFGTVHFYVESWQIIEEWRFSNDARIDMQAMRKYGKDVSIGEFGAHDRIKWSRLKMIQDLIDGWMTDYQDMLLNALYWGVDTYVSSDRGIHDNYGLYPFRTGDEARNCISLFSQNEAKLSWA